MTICLLVVGIITSFLKGFDYEEAIALSILLIAMLPCRHCFYRKGSLFSPTLDFNWLASIMLSFGLLVWIVLFAYRHVEYSNDLWWEFAYRGDAPRSLRALVGVGIVFLLAIAGKLLHSRPAAPAPPTDGELANVEG